MSNALLIIGGGENECTACLKEKDGVALESDSAEIFLCWLCLKKEVRIRRAASEKKSLAAGV